MKLVTNAKNEGHSSIRPSDSETPDVAGSRMEDRVESKGERQVPPDPQLPLEEGLDAGAPAGHHGSQRLGVAQDPDVGALGRTLGDRDPSVLDPGNPRDRGADVGDDRRSDVRGRVSGRRALEERSLGDRRVRRGEPWLGVGPFHVGAFFPFGRDHAQAGADPRQPPRVR